MLSLTQITPLKALANEEQNPGTPLEMPYPKDGDVFNREFISVDCSGEPGTVIELYVNGVKYDKTFTLGPTGNFRFVSVPLQGGENKLELKGKDKEGKEVIVSKNVYLVGAPSKIIATPAQNSLSADGESKLEINLKVLDQWGRPVRDGTFIEAKTNWGEIINDYDTKAPGVQLRVENGEAKAILRSQVAKDASVGGGGDPQSGKAVLSFKVNDIVEQLEIAYTPPLRDLIMIGLGTITIGNKDIGGDTTFVQGYDHFKDGFYHDGRFAFFTKGRVWGGYLLTMAYDTEAEKKQRLFKDFDPDQYYPVYGDTSTLFYDAQSNDKIYFKLEKNRNYLLYGDFSTDFNETELSAYSRTLNGVRLNIDKSPKYKFVILGAKTDNDIVRNEQQGKGISGYYFLPNIPIVVGSEQVVIITRDRFHPEVILKQEPLTRFNDYTIDYFQGSILFKQPIPSLDENQNPVYIVTIYESRSAEESDLLTAARARIGINDHISIGGTFINENRTISDYRLVGSDIEVKLPANTKILGEYAQSKNAGVEDDAYKVELTSSPFSNFQFKGYFRYLGKDFVNPSSNSTYNNFLRNNTGTANRKFGVEASYRISSSADLQGEYYKEHYFGDTSNTTMEVANLSFQQRWGRMDFRAKYEHRNEFDHLNGKDVISNIGIFRVGYNPTDKISTFVERQQNFGKKAGQESALRPNQTVLGLDYRINSKVKVYVRHRFIDRYSSASGYERYVSGGYLDGYGESNLTTIGVESNLTNNLSTFAKYEVADAMDGNRAMASIGLNNKIPLRKDLTLNLAYERRHTLNGKKNGSDFDALSIGFEYMPNKRFNASGKYEFRNETDARSTDWTVNAIGEVNDDLSLILKHRYFKRDASANAFNPNGSGARNVYTSIGLAYRPTKWEKLNILARYEHRRQAQESVVPSADREISIFSIDTFYKATRKLRLSARYAYKTAKDLTVLEPEQTHTHLILGDVTYDINDRIDLRCGYRVLKQRESNTWNKSYMVGLGFKIVDNLMAVVGYNFQKLEDEDFAQNNVWTKGPFLTLEYKFDETTGGFLKKSEKRRLPLEVSEKVEEVEISSIEVNNEPPPVEVLGNGNNEEQHPTSTGTQEENNNKLINVSEDGTIGDVGGVEQGVKVQRTKNETCIEVKDDLTNTMLKYKTNDNSDNKDTPQFSPPSNPELEIKEREKLGSSNEKVSQNSIPAVKNREVNLILPLNYEGEEALSKKVAQIHKIELLANKEEKPALPKGVVVNYKQIDVLKLDSSSLTDGSQEDNHKEL